MPRQWTHATYSLIILSLFICFLSSDSASSAENQQVALVANPDLGLSAITADEIKGIYLGKISKLDNKAITIVTLKGGTIHDTFLKTYVKKSDKQFDTFWKKLLFTGKAQMPKSLKSEKEMLDYVSKTKGAVGYVAANSPLLQDTNTTVVTIK